MTRWHLRDSRARGGRGFHDGFEIPLYRWNTTLDYAQKHTKPTLHNKMCILSTNVRFDKIHKCYRQKRNSNRNKRFPQISARSLRKLQKNRHFQPKLNTFPQPRNPTYNDGNALCVRRFWWLYIRTTTGVRRGHVFTLLVWVGGRGLGPRGALEGRGFCGCWLLWVGICSD